ncbi:MAG TPA: hypothetical protein VLG36_00875 [Candidatus Chromulinivoraceae bacterium]|nr:hypothetical protein [Candidatus Chromulinivoraceae bacterium]
MEIGVEQETDYKYETPEVNIIIEGDLEFSIGGIYESSNLIEAERTQEYGATIQKYVVEDDGFYPLEDSGETGSTLPLLLNDEQQQAVQIALLGGEAIVEILAPSSTDEMEVWSIQTFTFDGVVDGRQTFTLSARSEERPKLREEPEANFDRGSDYDSFESSSGDGVGVSVDPSYEVSGRDVALADTNSESYDLDISIGEPKIENVSPYEVSLVEQLVEIFSELNVVAVAQGEVERAKPTTAYVAEVGEGAGIRVEPDGVVKSVDADAKLAPSVFKTEVFEKTATIVDDQDEIDEPIVELVVAAIEIKDYVAADVEQPLAETLLDDPYEPRIEGTEMRVGDRSQTSPVTFQPNETIYVREQAPVLLESDVIARATLVEERTVVRPYHYVEPPPRAERKVATTRPLEDQEEQVSQVTTREDGVDERMEESQRETFTLRETSTTLRKESKRGEVARTLNPEITSRQSKKAMLHAVEPAAWERASFVMPNISKTSVFNVTEGGDDIVISFESSRITQRARKARAESLAV